MSGLRELTMPKADTSNYALCQFLMHLRNSLKCCPNTIIYSMEVAFLNQETLNNDVERRLKFFDNELKWQQEAAKAQGSPFSAEDIDQLNEEAKDAKADLYKCGLVTNAARFYKASKCNYFLVSSAHNRCWLRGQAFKHLPTGAQLLNALHKYKECRDDWHSYAIRISNRKMYIYEPNYKSYEASRLKDYPFGRRALDLRNEIIKTRKKIEEVWIGGGGNSAGRCRTMACHWLRGEVMSDIGEGEEMRVPVEWTQISV